MKSNIGVTTCVCSMSFPVSCDHGFSVVVDFPFIAPLLGLKC